MYIYIYILTTTSNSIVTKYFVMRTTVDIMNFIIAKGFGCFLQFRSYSLMQLFKLKKRIFDIYNFIPITTGHMIFYTKVNNWIT